MARTLLERPRRLSNLSETGLTRRTGKQAGIAGTTEASGQGLAQKAADELVGANRHACCRRHRPLVKAADMLTAR